MKARHVFSCRSFSRILPYAFLILIAPAHANPAAPSIPSTESIFTLINQRLSYMEDVALYKVHNGLPVEDSIREQWVISAASSAGVALGLNSESVEALISAQIAVAKAIQYRYRADWLTTPSDKSPQDLQAQIRPKLILLGNEILRELAGLLQSGQRIESADRGLFDKLITVRHVTDVEKQLLFSTLEKVSLSNDAKRFINAVIEGSAEHPDPVLQKVLALENQGLVKDVKVLERFPVEIHLAAPEYIIEQLRDMPRKPER